MDEKTGARKKRVLIVDDEAHIAKVFSVKLRLAGFDVISTTSGSEAIEMVRAQRPDVVLCDILMPEVTGFDVLDKVRAFSQVPIIVFTARSEIAQAAIRLGANGSVAKPLDPDRLIEKINLVLDARARGKPPDQAV